jgi:hypothetical protein
MKKRKLWIKIIVGLIVLSIIGLVVFILFGWNKIRLVFIWDYLYIFLVIPWIILKSNVVEVYLILFPNIDHGHI